MATSNTTIPLLLPKLKISSSGIKKPIEIGSIDDGSVIHEINFYSQLNSFSFNADVTIEDVDNQILNMLNEFPIKVVLELYVVNDLNPTANINNRFFHKKFMVNKVKILKFDTSYPYKSLIQLNLIDILEPLSFGKIIYYSNFNLNWKDERLNPENVLQTLLKTYQKYCGNIVINNELFGVSKESLRRRLVLDNYTSVEEAVYRYIDSLYNTRCNDGLSSTQPKRMPPKCLLAFTNRYTLDDNGILHQRPFLTSINNLDKDPNKPMYAVPYSDRGNILLCAKKDIDLCVGGTQVFDTSIDLRGAADIENRSELMSQYFRIHSFDPHTKNFEDTINSLKDMTQLNPPVDVNIESVRGYLGIGENPKFKQNNVFDKKQIINYPYNIKENKYYYSDEQNSFYQDASNVLLKPLIYVSIPDSAWHSPGQEVDLRMTQPLIDKITKESMYSMNKLVSGRWKIINTVTKFKQPHSGSDMVGLIPVETLGLSRLKYLE